MGEFALSVAAAHQIGAARGERSILSAMDIHAGELFAIFSQSINDLVLRHRSDLERKGALGGRLKRRRSKSEPKARWVDATPEYAFHICGLRKLFPGAVFIHLVRDVDSVVRSMLNFHRVTGTHLVTSEQNAYEYWLRAVKACLKAEQAYGADVVYRLLYSTLVKEPELAFRSLLDFVGEPYSDRCLDPLAERINSSNVPPDFKSGEAATDPAIVQEARRLSAEIEGTAQPSNGSLADAADLESAFREASVESYVKIARLEQQLSDQERHYTAEVKQYETQIASQERHYTAEVEQYETQIASQERHYTAELEQYRTQIASQEHHYTSEVEQYKAQISAQQRDYTAALQGYRSETRLLMRMLNQLEKAAARLRESRRWKLVNFAAVIKAKLSSDKQLPGYDDLDKIVAAYAQWRVSRAKPTNTDRLATATAQTDSANSGERLANDEGTGKPTIPDRLAKPAGNTCGV